MPDSTGSLKPKFDWNKSILKIPGEWRNTEGEGVGIAILDSGIYSSHPDLKHLKQYQNERFFNHCVDKHPESDHTFEDKWGHGTRCAGLIAAKPTSPKV